MKSFKFKLPLVVALSAVMTLSGCQSLGLGSAADPELTTGRQAKVFSKSGVQACLMGGALGALSGGLLGATKNKDTAIAGAVAGAVVGCAGAVTANYYMEKKRAQYANKEDRLNAYIAELREKNEAAQESITAARNVLKRDQQTLAKLNQQISSKSVQASQAKKELARVDANLKVLNERLTAMKETRDMYKQVSQTERKDGVKVAKLDAEINKLNKQISTLENLVVSASKQRTAIRLG